MFHCVYLMSSLLYATSNLGDQVQFWTVHERVRTVENFGQKQVSLIVLFVNVERKGRRARGLLKDLKGQFDYLEWTIELRRTEFE